MSEPFDLDPAHWVRLRALLDTALQLDEAQRPAWIDRLDATDAPLVPRLRALLSHAPALQGAGPTVARLLHTLPGVETGQFAPHPPVGAPAEQVGPYRLVRELGRGGMASVWLAERTDVLQGRRAAIKLPLGTWQATGLAERLARERAILATLNHPHIATLYDAGVDDQGRPWLALEHVEGERIDAWCERQQLDVPARLRLFVQVAQAVAHAHARLVVHRDLKPGNILVTGEGQVKLLDFGIAKLLEEDLAGEAAELTQQAGLALTPDYAAPEQIAGLAVGTAADVYALGVVLYELLAGARPYALARGPRAALQAAIQALRPLPPSAAAAARGVAWQRRLRGDLDTIVLKAMKAEPAERYATVAALADDLQRHLDGLPVAAQPDRLGYRLRKFVARNRLVVGAGAGVAAALLIGTAVSLWQAQVARNERNRAERVKDFVTQLLTNANPNLDGGRKLTVDRLLLNARPRIDEQFAEEPRIRAELLTILGISLGAVGEREAALAQLQAATQIAEAAFGPDDPQSLQARGMWLNARRLSEPGQALVDEIDGLLARMRLVRGVDPEYLASVLAERAQIAMQEGQAAQAVALATESLQRIEQQHGQVHPQTLYSAVTLALAYQRLGDRDKALEAAQRVHRLVFDVRKMPDTRGPAVDARLMLGMALADVGRVEEGLKELEAGVRNAQVERAPNDPAVGSFRSHLARYQLRAGRVAEAIRNYESAFELLRGSSGTRNRRAAAASLQLGAAHLAARRPERAKPALLEAQAYFAGTQEGSSGPLIPMLAATHALLGDLGAARALLDQFPTGGWQSEFRRGQIERLGDQAEAALPRLAKAWEQTTDSPADSIARAEIAIEQGLALSALKRWPEACQSFERASALLKATQLQPSAALAQAWFGAASCMAAQGQAAEARKLAEASMAIWASEDAAHPMAMQVAGWLERHR